MRLSPDLGKYIHDLYKLYKSELPGAVSPCCVLALGTQQQINWYLCQLHPVVLPHVSHFMQVPLRTNVKFPHSPQASPS